MLAVVVLGMIAIDPPPFWPHQALFPTELHWLGVCHTTTGGSLGRVDWLQESLLSRPSRAPWARRTIVVRRRGLDVTRLSSATGRIAIRRSGCFGVSSGGRATSSALGLGHDAERNVSIRCRQQSKTQMYRGSLISSSLGAKSFAFLIVRRP